MKVSVIVPVYNVGNLIEKCLHSLLSQTLDDIEYIFIDDCSTDNSVLVIEEVLSQYPSRKERVRLVRMPYNIGVAAARHRGVELANGEYVIFCDSDDWVNTCMFEELYTTCKGGDYDIVICDYNITNGDQRNLHVSQKVPRTKLELMSKLLSGRVHGSLCNKMVKRILYENIIFPVGNMREDLAMLIQLLHNASKFHYINRPYYNYYVRSGSVSSGTTDVSIINRYEQSLLNYDLIEKFVEAHNLNMKKPLLALRLSIMMTVWNLSDRNMLKKIWNDNPLKVSLIDLLMLDVPVNYKIKYLLLYYSIK